MSEQLWVGIFVPKEGFRPSPGFDPTGTENVDCQGVFYELASSLFQECEHSPPIGSSQLLIHRKISSELLDQAYLVQRSVLTIANQLHKN